MQVELCRAYTHIPEYLTRAPGVPEADLPALYREVFVEPYWGRCTDGRDHLGARYALKSTRRLVTDLNAFARFGAELRARDFGGLAQAALRTCNALLPGPDTTAYLMAQNPRNTGFQREGWQGSGLCAGAGRIWLYVAPVGDWTAHLPFLVAHEYHHSVWVHRHGPEMTFDLLEYVVFEGRANVFAELVAGRGLPAVLQGLDGGVLRRAWADMRPHLRDRDPATLQAFVFGNEARSIPPLAGYTVGFALVRAFLSRHPELSVDEWTALDAATLVGESGYGEG